MFMNMKSFTGPIILILMNMNIGKIVLLNAIKKILLIIVLIINERIGIIGVVSQKAILSYPALLQNDFLDNYKDN